MRIITPQFIAMQWQRWRNAQVPQVSQNETPADTVGGNSASLHDSEDPPEAFDRNVTNNSDRLKAVEGRLEDLRTGMGWNATISNRRLSNVEDRLRDNNTRPAVDWTATECNVRLKDSRTGDDWTATECNERLERLESPTNPSFCDCGHAWADATSIHGVGAACDFKKYNLLKLFLYWSLVICLAVLMILAVLEAKDEYDNQEFATHSAIIVTDSLPFPQVTACYSNKLAASGYNDKTNFIGPKNEEELIERATPLNLQKDSHGFSGNWTEETTFYGRCWVFRADKEHGIPGERFAMNFASGFEDPPDEEPAKDNLEGLGMRVFVTPPNVNVVDGTVSFFVPAQKMTYIALSPIIIKRWEEPLTFYRDIWPDKLRGSVLASDKLCESKPKFPTQQHCLNSCLQQTTRDLCQCRLIGDPVNDTNYCAGVPGAFHCETVIAPSRVNLTSCNCTKPPCYETFYRVDVSRFDDDSSSIILTNISTSNSSNLTSYSISYTSRVASARINFNIIQIEESSESPPIPRSALVGIIGGILGVFLGVSLMGFYEIVDLVICRLLCNLPWPPSNHVRHLNGIGEKTA